MIELDLAARPADQQLAADQVTELRAHMRGSYTPRCRQQPRGVITCILAATTTSAARDCDP